MAKNDNNFATICPLAYTDIEVHYCVWWFSTCRQWVDEDWNTLQWWSVYLFNDLPVNVCAPTIWWYEFDHREFTDSNWCVQCVSDDPISLLTCRTS